MAEIAKIGFIKEEFSETLEPLANPCNQQMNSSAFLSRSADPRIRDNDDDVGNF